MSNCLVKIKAKNDALSENIGFFFQHNHMLGILTTDKYLNNYSITEIVLTNFSDNEVFEFKSKKDAEVLNLGHSRFIHISKTLKANFTRFLGTRTPYKLIPTMLKKEYSLPCFYDKRTYPLQSLSKFNKKSDIFAPFCLSNKEIEEKHCGTPIVVDEKYVYGIILDIENNSKCEKSRYGNYLPIVEILSSNYLTFFDKAFFYIKNFFYKISLINLFLSIAILTLLAIIFWPQYKNKIKVLKRKLIRRNNQITENAKNLEKIERNIREIIKNFDFLKYNFKINIYLRELEKHLQQSAIYKKDHPSYEQTKVFVKHLNSILALQNDYYTGEKPFYELQEDLSLIKGKINSEKQSIYIKYLLLLTYIIRYMYFNGSIENIQDSNYLIKQIEKNNELQKNKFLRKYLLNLKAIINRFLAAHDIKNNGRNRIKKAIKRLTTAKSCYQLDHQKNKNIKFKENLSDICLFLAILHKKEKNESFYKANIKIAKELIECDEQNKRGEKDIYTSFEFHYINYLITKNDKYKAKSKKILSDIILKIVSKKNILGYFLGTQEYKTLIFFLLKSYHNKREYYELIKTVYIDKLSEIMPKRIK